MSARRERSGGSLRIAQASALCFSVCCLSSLAAAQTGVAGDAPPADASPPYTAWRGAEPYAPPPVIALGAAPAPELAPPSYTRRPVELTTEALFGISNCSSGANNARCSGLGPGVGFGLIALWRLSPYLALAGTFNALGFASHPSAGTRLRDSSGSGSFYGLLGRVYFVERGSLEPYLELGAGHGSEGTVAREASAARYSETAAGSALRVGLGVEFYLAGRLRIGPALVWTRFWSDQVQRCDAAESCTSLAGSSVGHGTGFASISARATILLGPAL